MPELRKHIPNPAIVEELTDHDVPSYSVRCGEKLFHIYGPELNEPSPHSWGRATDALFRIVNEQLAESECRFYAINGGNDLCGMFLTPAQAQAAQRTLPNRQHWPYLPSPEPPWYGQYH